MNHSSTESQSPALTFVSKRLARCNIPQPFIEVRFEKGVSPRLVRATLHRILADVEAATPADESWDVEVELLADVLVYSGGRVLLNLWEGNAEEAKRGMAVLDQVVSA